jgi:hypothetical protein
MVMDNPKDKKYFHRCLLGSIVVFILGTSYVMITSTKWSILTIVIMTLTIIFCSSIPLLMGWRREYLWRPYQVGIRDDGLLLHRYYHKEPRLVSWEQISSFYAPPGDPALQKTYFSRDGCFYSLKHNKNQREEMVIVHWPIAIAAREKYREEMGHYPAD